MSTPSDEYRGSRSWRRGSAPPKKGSSVWKWMFGGCAFILFLGCGLVVAGIVAGVNWIDKKLDGPEASVVLAKHPNRQVIVAVVYSPDGSRIATASGDGPIWIWNADTGESVLSIGAGPHRAMAFSPDGTRLAIGGGIWDAATGKKLISFGPDDFAPLAIAYSPDGTRLAAPYGSSARVWDAKTGKELLVLKGHPDGVLLGMAGLAGGAGEAGGLLVLKGHFSGVSSVAFSPDGSGLVTGSRDGTIRLWDAATGEEVRKMEAVVEKLVRKKERDDIKAAQPVVVQDPEDIKVDQPVVVKTRVPISRTQFGSDGKQVWGVAKAGFWTWDAATGDKITWASIPDIDKEGDLFAIHSGTNRLARAYDNRVTIWDLTTGAITHQLRTKVGFSLTLESDRLSCIEFSPDGTRIVGGARDGTIWVLKLDE